MSQRKPYNHQARLANYYRSMLRSNHVAVLDVEHLELQTIINWKNGTLVTSNSRVALVDAITERPYRWTIYLAGLHRPANGEPYMKSEELALEGIYRAESLIDVIEPRSIELKARCNPNHLLGMAWIAIPYQATLTTAEASRIFEAFGAWRTKEAA
ncbi:MAG: hypothetical protein AB1459_17760 [Pseudomonadota bacterium]